MMTLTLPAGQVLRLGQDLTASFPDVLAVIDQPELAALLQRERTGEGQYLGMAQDGASVHLPAQELGDGVNNGRGVYRGGGSREGGEGGPAAGSGASGGQAGRGRR